MPRDRAAPQVHPTTAYQMHNNAAAWDPDCVPHLRRVSEQIQEHGALAFLQLAHNGGVNHAIWSRLPVWSASGIANHMEASKAISHDEIREVVEHYARSARNAADGGFDGIEVHGAHGYLIHEFLSPAYNLRTDEYGGSFENRTRLPLAVVDAVREVWPERLPLLVRISATDWLPEGEGWDADQSVELSRLLAGRGVDLVDVSTGGLAPGVSIPVGPGYQVPFAARVRHEAGMATGAVGMITEPKQAQDILATGEADVVLLARALLRDPYWALHAAQQLEVEPASTPWPPQYLRAL